jgi:type I restriction enzyme, S subunit
VWTVSTKGKHRQIASGEWIVYRDHGCDPSYLRYCLTEETFRKQFLSTVAGVGGSLMRARPSEVSNIAVAIAPGPEQRRIVAKLDSLTGRTARAREQLGRIPKLIQKYREAILSAATEGKLVRPTTTWKVTPLGDNVSWGPQNGIYLPQSKYGSGVPILRIDDFQTGWVKSRKLIRFVMATKAEQANYALKTGDIVINRVNSPSHLGKLIVIPHDLNGAIFESNMMRFRVEKAVLPELVVVYLSSRKGMADLKKHAKWAVNQASINQGDVLGVNIPVPSIQEQLIILSALTRAFAWLDRIVSEYANASRLLPRLDQAILTKAFRGDLVPQDPNDQPVEICAADAGSPARRGRLKRASN